MSRLSNGISILYRTEDQNVIKLVCLSMSNMKILVPTANVYASYHVETVMVAVAAIELNLRTLSFECIEPKPNKSVRVRNGWHSFEILYLKLGMKKNILSHLANQPICHLVTYLTNRMAEKKYLRMHK